jgi:ferrous-iron efflux pump FieF
MAIVLPRDEMKAGALMRRAALAAICVAAALAALKAAAWWWTDSVAMLASFADSALDLVASGVNAFAIHHALAPADREHRFGHGKAEAVAGLAQSALVGGSALFLSWQSLARILAPEPLSAEGWGIGVMVVSMAATLALTRYQGHVARESGSVAVAADRLHYIGDLAANVAVVLALGLTAWLGWLWADGAFGLVIAGTIAFSAWTILRQSLDQLIDRELPEGDRSKIQAIAAAVTGVRGIHDLRTRAAGLNIFVQLHIDVDPGLTVKTAHGISDTVEVAILEAFPNADVLIHTDPAGVPELRRPLAFVKA